MTRRDVIENLKLFNREGSEISIAHNINNFYRLIDYIIEQSKKINTQEKHIEELGYMQN